MVVPGGLAGELDKHWVKANRNASNAWYALQCLLRRAICHQRLLHLFQGCKRSSAGRHAIVKKN